MTTFIDTCIIIAILNDQEPHHSWSVRQFTDRKLLGPALISDIVYSELSAGMATKEHVDETISQLALERIQNDDVTLFRAGVAYKVYKSRGSTKSNVLPDFLIGAIAEVNDIPLMTANSKDFKKYFPKLNLISPT
jgi:predicted nucleic acid-binding protein